MAKTNLEKTVSDIEVDTKSKKTKKMSLKKILILTLLVIAIGGISGSTYYYNKYNALKLNANVEAEKETKRLVGVLGKLMELPQEETPTVATISDKEKLKDQSFFDKAENGDILFAYTNAMKAILYRPSTNKIINVAPISINQQQDVSGGVQQETPAPQTEE
jgi:hypothetical protein